MSSTHFIHIRIPAMQQQHRPFYWSSGRIKDTFHADLKLNWRRLSQQCMAETQQKCQQKKSRHYPARS